MWLLVISLDQSFLELIVQATGFALTDSEFEFSLAPNACERRKGWNKSKN